MSSYYYVYAEAKYKDKWYSINPIVKKADGTYLVKEVFWAQSGFRQMYYDLEDMAIDRGILDDFSPEVRAKFHENLDDIYSDFGSQITYAYLEIQSLCRYAPVALRSATTTFQLL